MHRRTFVGLMAAAPLATTISTPAWAAKPETFAVDGIAIRGIDPVGYFTDSAPIAGSAEFTSDYNGATWQFASAENKATFDADPETYAPQYGGYCAYAVSKGATAPTDPEAWTVHDGKLYLNFSVDVRSIWKEDIPGNVAKADANWPKVLEA